jgi:hypothetical protein
LGTIGVWVATSTLDKSGLLMEAAPQSHTSSFCPIRGVCFSERLCEKSNIFQIDGTAPRLSRFFNHKFGIRPQFGCFLSIFLPPLILSLTFHTVCRLVRHRCGHSIRTWVTFYSNDIGYTLLTRSTLSKFNPTLDTIPWILFNCKLYRLGSHFTPFPSENAKTGLSFK